ncbi:transcriptional regulator [Pasteurellaceae bacterium Macca]|nr:transcriptional regulator [Pasteurellaceae bacterium Macca]
MYDYRSAAIFATVIEQGSMHAAAEKLAISPSAITQAIQKLETQLNMKLLNRTTRKISLTEAGEVLYQHNRQIQRNAEEALKELDLLRSNPAGELTIACVTGLMDSPFMGLFQSVLEQHPEFKLNILFEDKVLNLLDKRVDIALRAGEGVLSDNMIARHIYDFHWKIVAHPDYLARKGMPADFTALAKADWISFAHHRFQHLNLQRHNEACQIAPEYRVNANSLYASRCLTLNGLGISLQPEIDVKTALAKGELVSLFDDWQLPTTPLYLVTLQRAQSEKVRLASELIMQYFSQLSSSSENSL